MKKHPEGFALMRYRCDLGHTETLWNSRDGVTPFGIGCNYCNSYNSLHVDWQLDQYAPKHKPKKGTRIFIDLTPEKHKEYIKRRLDGKSDDYGLIAKYGSVEAVVEAIFKDEWQEGSPDIIVVEEDWK